MQELEVDQTSEPANERIEEVCEELNEVIGTQRALVNELRELTGTEQTPANVAAAVAGATGTIVPFAPAMTPMAPPVNINGNRPLALDQLVKLGDVVIDRLQHEVHCNGKVEILTPNEGRLLNFLIGHAGEVLTREQIASGAWGPAFADRSGEVEVYISRLRKKISASKQLNSRVIQTVRGRGYTINPRQLEPAV